MQVEFTKRRNFGSEEHPLYLEFTAHLPEIDESSPEAKAKAFEKGADLKFRASVDTLVKRILREDPNATEQDLIDAILTFADDYTLDHSFEKSSPVEVIRQSERRRIEKRLREAGVYEDQIRVALSDD